MCSYGVVYLAEDLKTGNTHALKVRPRMALRLPAAGFIVRTWGLTAGARAAGAEQDTTQGGPAARDVEAAE